MVYQDSVIQLAENRFIVRLDIQPNQKRPILFWAEAKRSESYVRVNDMSIKASDAMIEIIRRKRQKKDIRFYFAEHELALMKYLDQFPFITLMEFQKLTGLNQYAASRKLILLVLANALKITATEKEICIRGFEGLLFITLSSSCEARISAQRILITAAIVSIPSHK